MVGGRHVKLQIWDTAGQERFRSVTRSYYRGSAAVLLVYDITRRSTFADIARWLDDARALAAPHAAIVLVGNKLDRAAEEREVEFLEASAWARAHDVLFTETSSLTGENVDVPFVLCARQILLDVEAGRLDPARADAGVAYGERALYTHGSESQFSFARQSVADDGSETRPLLLTRLAAPLGACCWQA